MRYLLVLCIVSITACYQSASVRVDREMKKHLVPKDSIVNTMERGETFVLESSETQGIDHERFKEFDYWKDMDATYFEHIADKEYSNPDEDGGTSTTLSIYKAIKKGYTEIKFYKRKYYRNKQLSDTTLLDTAQILYNTYKFTID